MSVSYAPAYGRGMTNQWKAKDLANTGEYLYGVANSNLTGIGSQSKKGTLKNP